MQFRREAPNFFNAFSARSGEKHFYAFFKCISSEARKNNLRIFKAFYAFPAFFLMQIPYIKSFLRIFRHFLKLFTHFPALLKLFKHIFNAFSGAKRRPFLRFVFLIILFLTHFRREMSGKICTHFF